MGALKQNTSQDIAFWRRWSLQIVPLFGGV